MDLHPPDLALPLPDRYRVALRDIGTVLPEVLGDSTRELGLDDTSLEYVDNALSQLNLMTPDADLLGDAYELFAGSALRGQEGQFFTPQNAVSLLLDLVDPKPGELIIDPACGSGAFLVTAAKRLIASGVAPSDAVAMSWGQEKDEFLAGLARTRLSFLSLEKSNVACVDSLGCRTPSGAEPPASSLYGRFDVVVTNPPFGAKIVAATPAVQKQFELGHAWRWNETAERFEKTDRLPNNVPPQVLFIERCLRLVRPGGRIGLVVPESLISGRNYRFVVSWLRELADIRAVVGMPESLFKTSGKGGTHTKTCLVYLEKRNDKGPKSVVRRPRLFMAEAKFCGNDSRGRRTERDDVPTIRDNWFRFAAGSQLSPSHLGYSLDPSALIDDVLAPRYYDPEIAKELKSLVDTHELVSVASLVADGTLSISTGHEIGAASYGTGEIPFVRTSDISNWELKLDPKHGVSDDVYQQFARKQDIRESDILMVRDGTYLVGTCAFVTKFDTRILFQSHLYKIRVNRPEHLSPYLLLAMLSSVPVRRQIKAKRFTQDIIDSLGNRVEELILPVPKDAELRSRVISMVERSINDRVEARELARQAQFEVIGGLVLGDVDPEEA
jgi:type I restriction enzyme M protein